MLGGGRARAGGVRSSWGGGLEERREEDGAALAWKGGGPTRQFTVRCFILGGCDVSVQMAWARSAKASASIRCPCLSSFFADISSRGRLSGITWPHMRNAEEALACSSAAYSESASRFLGGWQASQQAGAKRIGQNRWLPKLLV